MTEVRMLNDGRVRVSALAAAVMGLLVVGIFAMSPAAADKVAEVRLEPNQSYSYERTSPMASVDAAFYSDPLECEEPPYSAGCDAFHLDLNLDTSEEAFNFVVARLDWDGGADPPSVITPAVGLSPGPVVDYAMSVWEKDEEGTWVRNSDVTGGLARPEIIGFEARRADYAITVQILKGASIGYVFDVEYSNERFAAPFEVLDPALNDGSFEVFEDLPEDTSTFEDPFAIDPAPLPEELAPVEAPAMVDLAPLEEDADFSGFRPDVDDNLAGNLAAATREAPQLVAADPPPIAVVLLWLLVAPLIVAGFVLAVIRKRRPAALAA